MTPLLVGTELEQSRHCAVLSRTVLTETVLRVLFACLSASERTLVQTSDGTQSLSHIL